VLWVVALKLEKRPVTVESVEKVEKTAVAVKLDRVEIFEPPVVDKVLSAVKVMLEKRPIEVEMLETVEARLAVLT
jgi:transcriptional regulator NrdR family protein